MQANISIVSKNSSGKEISTTVSYINPITNSAKLVELARALNGLTNNQYVETNRTDKINCDTEESGGVTPTPTPVPLLNPNLSVTIEPPDSIIISRLGTGYATLVSDNYENGNPQWVILTGNDDNTIDGGFEITIDTSYSSGYAVYLESDGTYAAAFTTANIE